MTATKTPQLTVTRHTLLDSLSALRTVVPTKSQRPVLESVEARCEGDALRLRGTDLDRTAFESVETLRHGALLQPTLFPLTPALAFLKAAEGETVTLDANATRLALATDADETFEVLTRPADEFPVAPEAPRGTRVELPADYLRDTLARLLPIAAREAGRYAMQGVLIELTSDGLVMVSTDGRRCAKATRALAHLASPVRAILCSDAAQYLARFLPKAASDVALTFPEVGEDLPKVGVAWGSSQLLARPLDGEFPRYSAVIRASSRNCATLQSDELTRRLKTVKAACSADARAIRVEPDAGSECLSLWTKSADSTSRVKVSAKLELSKHAPLFAVSPDFLLDGVKACDADQIRLGWNDAITPIQLEAPGFAYALMPITIDS